MSQTLFIIDLNQ